MSRCGARKGGPRFDHRCGHTMGCRSTNFSLPPGREEIEEKKREGSSFDPSRRYPVGMLIRARSQVMTSSIRLRSRSGAIPTGG